MSLFTLWQNPDISRYEVVTIAEGIKTNPNAVLTGCTTEHPVIAANCEKCCNIILTAGDRPKQCSSQKAAYWYRLLAGLP